MIDLKLTLDETEMDFSIPENWEEVTVEQYAKLYSGTGETTTIERTVRFVNILTNINIDYLYQMSSDQFIEVTEVLGFMNEEVKEKQVDSIDIAGDTFFVKDDYDKMNVGEVASIEMLMKESTNGTMLDKFPELLCIFLRKKKENGKLESFRIHHMDRAEQFKSISISDVHKLLLFFSNGAKKFTSTMKPSLVSKKKKPKKKAGSKN